MPTGQRRDKLLKHRLDLFVRMLHGVERGDVRALHRTRVASRRLRELLPVLGLDRASTRKLGRRLRRVTAGLGPVRELDVLMSLVDELRESGRFSPDAVQQVADVIGARRAAARARLGHKMPADDLRRTANRLGRIVDDLACVEDAASRTDAREWQWALDARIARRREVLGAAIDAAGAVYMPERLHRVRIAAKKLRYALELATEAGLGHFRREVSALKRTQDLLGRMHDRQVLVAWVRQVQAQAAEGTASEHDLDAIVTEAEEECRRLHARYLRSREALLRLAGRADRRHPVTPIALRRVAAG